MMPDYIADDYAFIAQRMRELSLDTGAGARWGIWWRVENIWLHIACTGTVKRAGPNNPPSLFDSKEQAQKVIDRGRVAGSIEPRPYPEDPG